MKTQRLLVTFVILLFLLIGGAVWGGFYSYQDFSQKIDSLDRRNMLITRKVEYLTENLDSFKENLAKLDTLLKDYSTTLTKLGSRINTADKERTTLLSNLNSLRENIKNWKNKYAAHINEIKTSLVDLKNTTKDLAANKLTHKVELGEISVEKSVAKVAQK